MTGIEAITSVAAQSAAPCSQATGPAPVAPSATFGDLMSQGLSNVSAKVERADALIQQFALDDSIPIHEVTIALEEARIAVDLALQVRTRLVEGYREIMNMQL